MSIRRISIWILILGLSAWIVYKIDGAVSSGLLKFGDFLNYWSAGRVFLSGGDPYSANELLQVQKSVGVSENPAIMWNPPWTILFMLPFILMPYGIARGVFFVVGIGILVYGADWLWLKSGGPPTRRWIGWLGGLLFLPCLLALFQGQVNLLVLGGLIVFLWAIDQKHDLAGGFAALAISLKPQLIHLFWIVLVFWIWKRRRWRILAGTLIFLLVSVCLILAINPSAIFGYLAALKSGPGPLVWMTPSSGVLLMCLFSPAIWWLRFVPMLAGWLGTIFLHHRWMPNFSWNSHLNSILLFSIATCSFCWTTDWVVLLPVVIMVLVWFAHSPARNWWLAAGLAGIQLAVVIIACKFSYFNYGEFTNLWVPFALWILYWLGGKSAKASRSALLANRRESGS